MLTPGKIYLDEVSRAPASYDALASRQVRLAASFEKVSYIDVALGSDAMAAALQCYAQLKLAGRASSRASGLDSCAAT